MKDFLEQLCEEGREDLCKVLEARRVNAITLCYEAADDEEIPVGASKFGGYPDLPPEIPYPVMPSYTEHFGAKKTHPASAMQLLYQIDLSKAAAFDRDHLLPETGMLYVFWSGELPALCKDCFKAIYYDGDHSVLRRTKPEVPYYQKYFQEVLAPSALGFTACYDYDLSGLRKEFGDWWEDALYDCTSHASKLLGIPWGVNYDGPRNGELCLLQETFQNDVLDMGCLQSIYFHIRREDLKCRSFEQVSLDYDLD